MHFPHFTTSHSPNGLLIIINNKKFAEQLQNF
jgi:hypothetical protein